MITNFYLTHSVCMNLSMLGSAGLCCEAKGGTCYLLSRLLRSFSFLSFGCLSFQETVAESIEAWTVSLLQYRHISQFLTVVTML